MIYGEMVEKVKKHTTKTLVHRQTKTTDFDNFNKDLLHAPWHVGEIFDDLDDAYGYWTNLFDSIANEHAPMRKIPCKAKLIIYKSSILPHLTYCHLVGHNCRSSDNRNIERIPRTRT